MPLFVVVLLVLAGLVAAGALGVTVLRALDPTVKVAVLGWVDTSDTSVEVRFEVSRAADADVICALRAQDRDRADVGYAYLPVPADGTTLTRTTYTLTTSSDAFVVEVLGCAEQIDALEVPGPQLRPGTTLPAQLPPGYLPGDVP